MHTHANTMTPIIVRLLISEAFVVQYHYHNKIPGLHLEINTASASKVGNFRPFWGEAKNNKRSADEYLSFQITNSNLKVQLLRQHWVHLVRDHSACLTCN